MINFLFGNNYLHFCLINTILAHIHSQKETIMKTSNKTRSTAAPYLWGPGETTVEPPSAHTVVENPWVLLLSTGFALWVLSGIIA